MPVNEEQESYLLLEAIQIGGNLQVVGQFPSHSQAKEEAER
jgi:hypothetical protein